MNTLSKIQSHPPTSEMTITVLGVVGKPTPKPPYTKWWLKGANLKDGKIHKFRLMHHQIVDLMSKWFIPDVGFRPLAVQVLYQENNKALLVEEVYI